MKKHYHLIGINGIGVSGVARILLEEGHTVSGSDPNSSPLTDKLREMGATIYHEHKEENIKGADCLVVSSAIPYDNPEVIAARRDGIPIFHRAEVLGHIMRGRTGIAISGTHGKTTTSSMVACMLDYNRLDPTIVVGGELNGLMSNARLGSSRYMVVEADESDASFLYLDPRWIVVTSVDVDVNLNVAPYSHLNFDYDKTLNKVKDAFYEFMDRLPENGKAILCIEDENVRKMIPHISKPYMTYGLRADADLYADGINCREFGSTFDVYHLGKHLGKVKLRVPGKHNIMNTLAVIAIGMEIGISFEMIAEAMSHYTGVRRRFQKLGEVNDILVIDDYAHNPGKVKALLSGARTGGRRSVIAIFQPHRYTRTKFLFDEFAESFCDADTLIVTEIYSAGECPIVGVKGETLAKAISEKHSTPSEVYYIPHAGEILDFVQGKAQPGDIVITIGAGDIYKTGEQLVKRLSSSWLTQELAAC
ncbi:MAG: UDP-N-acetylmuramate--L-alanine ligase [Firmicutes bacterium]|nr:UDP-N-acetylmuramate--L-alanine ligase [Bacillota bacterium]